MDLTSIQDAFDRVSKKQKVSYTKTQDVIDRTLHEIEAAAKQLVQVSDWSPESQREVLKNLQAKLTEIGPSSNQVCICSLRDTVSVC